VIKFSRLAIISTGDADMFKKAFVFTRNSLLFIFVFFASVAFCVGVAVGYDELHAEGAFSTWKVVDNPPIKISKILAVDILTVWVESIDGSIYSLNIRCPSEANECNVMKWIKVDPDAADLPLDVPSGGTVIDRQDTCKFGDMFDLKFLRKPYGNVVECVRVSELNPNGVGSVYYAKTDTDKIQYLYTFPMYNYEFLALILAALCIGLVLGVVADYVIYIKLLRR
jgi:hypothetical protein